jgi:hypothetical protein
MTKIQNLKRFEHWILGFGIYLLFGYCNLVLYDLVLGIFSIRETQRYVLILTLPLYSITPRGVMSNV